MKKNLRAFLFLGLLALVPLFGASAHELIPKEVQEFIRTHPNATSGEIQAFASGTIPVVLSITGPGYWHTFRDFAVHGVHHILSGADHILFVIALLLSVTSAGAIMKLTGTFTLAHSITLLLAGFGVLALSSRVVEPLIAFSIAYVAYASTFAKKETEGFWSYFSGEKLGAIFFFGLFHGLGFAGLLTELKIPDNHFVWSLFAFNVGIEIGQLLIIVLVLPVLLYSKEKPWYPTFQKCLAGIIVILGLFWGVQRALGF